MPSSENQLGDNRPGATYERASERKTAAASSAEYQASAMPDLTRAQWDVLHALATVGECWLTRRRTAPDRRQVNARAAWSKPLIGLVRIDLSSTGTSNDRARITDEGVKAVKLWLETTGR